jgi:hypothetical protein
MDLIPLPFEEMVSLDVTMVTGRKRWWDNSHEGVRLQIEKKNRLYASKANKGRQEVVFQLGDWVWVHMWKEQFPNKRKSKLQPRDDGPFQVSERINDNVYKIDLSGEYGVSATFNVADLTLFDTVFDLRSNHFEERGMMWTSPETPARTHYMF